MQHAITGVYPAFAIDYSKVEISKGKLDGIGDPVVASGAAGMITITWTASDDSDTSNATDEIMVVFYDTVAKKFIYEKNAGQRSVLTADMKIPRLFYGDTLQGWVFFVSADGKMVSTSNYVGQVIAKA